MHRDDVRGALEAMASAVPAPSTDATATIARGQRRVRQRRLTLVGVVALLAAIVLAAGVIASTGGNGTPRVEAPVTTTLPLIHVGPGTTIPTAPVYNGPTPIGLAFVSPTEGWLCARSNMEYTQDAGTNWYNVRVPRRCAGVTALPVPGVCRRPGRQRVDGHHRVGRRRTRQVVHVSGRGRGDDTWTFPALPDDWTVRDLAFSDPLHGWAFALDRAGAATAMFVTDDGGATWNDAKPVRRATLFATATEGWAVPDISPGELTHTLDGGRTWERLSEPFSGAELRPIAARGADVVALVTGTDGERPSFEVSTDDGNSWREVRGPATIGAGPFVASAVDADHWQIGAGNQLFTTADRGRDWTRVAEFAGISEITGIHFLTPADRVSSRRRAPARPRAARSCCRRPTGATRGLRSRATRRPSHPRRAPSTSPAGSSAARPTRWRPHHPATRLSD